MKNNLFLSNAVNISTHLYQYFLSAYNYSFPLVTTYWAPYQRNLHIVLIPLQYSSTIYRVSREECARLRENVP